MLVKFQEQTAESVTEGHPDKICDQISDGLVDAYLQGDESSRCAIECLGGHGQLYILGEVTSKTKVDVEKVAADIYKKIGYQDKLDIVAKIVQQSPDIAAGVDPGGAGDQGIMYGYAIAETPEFLPKAVVLSHQLTRKLTELRKNKTLPWLMPDGKSQVTIHEGKVAKIVVSTQHTSDITTENLHQEIFEKVIKPVIPEATLEMCLINPTGIFVQGGFEADTGLTGRKIMVDTYGGLAPQGGGCFSGKDATKVDRSAAYMARYLAKNIVAKGWAKECLVSFAYAIGTPQPVMISAWTDTNYDAVKRIKDNFDLSPKAIIEFLKLRKPIFEATASYGHFGRDGFSWEEISKK